MIDINYLLFLAEIRERLGSGVAGFFVGVTKLGEEPFLLVLIAGIFWCISKRAGTFLLLGLVFSRTIGNALKSIFCIPRPWMRAPELIPEPEALKTATGFSFPSGHSVNAAAVWGGMAVLFWKNHWIRFFFLALAVLVGFSRNYLGVHTPQDVLVAFGCAALVLFGECRFLRYLEKNPDKDYLLLIAGFSLMTGLLMMAYFREFKPILGLNGEILLDPAELRVSLFKTAGLISGAVSGWWMERRFIKLDAKSGKITQKLLRFLLGAGILWLLIGFGSRFFALFLSRNWAYFAGEFLQLLFLTVIYPAIALMLPGGKRDNAAPVTGTTVQNIL